MGGKGGGEIVANAAMAAISSGADYTLTGFLNDDMRPGETLSGLPVLGKIDNWHDLSQDTVFIPSLHNYKFMRERLEKIRSLEVPPERWLTVRHPQSCVAQDAKIGYGSYIGACSVVEPGASVGNFTSIRSGAYVSHDVEVGDFVFVGANSTIAGRTNIGEGTHVGPNAVVRDQLSIGEYSILSIGSVVTKSTERVALVGGNPARKMARRF
jgi:sugar O-acyltransferase (sialic acid O-acetyltransferase NeuD family)